MIKIKAKFDEETNIFSVKANGKNTFTLENIALIEYLCEDILQNDEDMTMEKIFDLVKIIRKNREVI